MSYKTEPMIIQGGMGVAVSGWQLAKAVSRLGQLGVVSGTALAVVLARRLQLGDPGGHLRRAMDEFPIAGVAERVLERYFVEGGKPADKPFIPTPLLSPQPSQMQLDLMVLSNFVEVYLAREDHDGLVGINYLEKIQLPTLPSLFGAMLAGVDYVLMGAGIPRAIPGILDQLSQGEPVELAYHVEGAGATDQYVTRFDPVEYCRGELPWLARPKFLAIISSATLATMLARKATGHVDGFVVEGPTAGGHNAPPRGPLQLNERGEPIYGTRDNPDLKAIADLGRPFWMAGSFGSPEGLLDALEVGAAGVQIGTAFAFCEESGLNREIRQRVLAMSREGTVDVRTDPVASPTGFPFKVLSMDQTLSDEDTYERRRRVCDLGYLRHAYIDPDGGLGWRCGAEPVEDYLRKGGELADTVGRNCVCNGLAANVGMAQVRREDGAEKPLITAGDDARQLARYFPTTEATSYSAKDVVAYLLSGVETGVGAVR